MSSLDSSWPGLTGQENLGGSASTGSTCIAELKHRISFDWSQLVSNQHLNCCPITCHSCKLSADSCVSCHPQWSPQLVPGSMKTWRLPRSSGENGRTGQTSPVRVQTKKLSSRRCKANGLQGELYIGCASDSFQDSKKEKLLARCSSAFALQAPKLRRSFCHR